MDYQAGDAHGHRHHSPESKSGRKRIQYLKRLSNVDFVVAIGFICVLVSISVFIGWESWKTLKMQKKPARQTKKDVSVLGDISQTGPPLSICRR